MQVIGVHIMKILLLEWKSYCGPDIIEAFSEAGHDVTTRTCQEMTERNNPKFEQILHKELEQHHYDIVFTFNFFPIVSQSCTHEKVLYISWVYDNPLVTLYSCTVINPYNRIFLFDYHTYEYFHTQGITTVFYLPLCANTNRLCKESVNTVVPHDISFVGSLYTEPKQRLYDKLSKIDNYSKGYLDALTMIQAHIDGDFFLEKALTDSLLSAMQKVCPVTPNRDGAETPAYIYAQYFLGRRATAIARTDILNQLSKNNDVVVYTHENCHDILPNAIYGGKIDYYDTMPSVFHNSKINLNITLKTIQTGIPLRAWDILGCGGFLLSNFQQELCEYFIPGEDFIYYESIDDATEKAAYFLTHENERKEIAHNAFEKIAASHTFHHRVQTMFDLL